MGTYCAPLVADLFLFCYERDFMLSLSDNICNQADVVETFNLDWYQKSKEKKGKICAHTYTSIYISEKITDCLIYCILSNGEVIKYHKFISVVVIARCLNTGFEDRLHLTLPQDI